MPVHEGNPFSLTWDEVSARGGRNAMPDLAWRYRNHLHPDELRHATCTAWSLAEWPEPHLGPDRWERLFRRCGFMIDGVGADPRALAETLTLYRGAVPSRRLGMSWTRDLEQARWFARRFDGMSDQTPRTYRITVSNMDVLAYLHEARREDEYVLRPSVVGAAARAGTITTMPDDVGTRRTTNR